MEQYRSVQGELRNLKQENEFLFSVELWLLNSKVTRNNWQFINLEAHRALFRNIPVLVAYLDGGATVGDGHNFTMKTDPATGKKVPDFTGAEDERICGATSYSEADIRLEERDGDTWIVAKAYLWRWYARQLTDKIERMALQGRSMALSIEAVVMKHHMEGNVEVEEEYIPYGVTLLGDGVLPAVKGARIEMLQAMKEEFNALSLRAASYVGKPDEPKPGKNLTKKDVKTKMYLSKQRIMELQNKFGSEYTLLAARQDGSNITVLLLRNADLAFGVYLMGAQDSLADPEKIMYRNASIYVEMEEGDPIYADAYEAISFRTNELSENVATLTAENKRLNGDLEEAKGQLKAMRDFETRRRVQASKDHAKAVLNAFNANREEKVEEKVLSAILENADKGGYTNLMDADGNWTGLTAVEKDVKALCADAVSEIDARMAAAKKGQYVWDKLGDGHKADDDGSPAGLLSRLK